MAPEALKPPNEMVRSSEGLERSTKEDGVHPLSGGPEYGSEALASATPASDGLSADASGCSASGGSVGVQAAHATTGSPKTRQSVRFSLFFRCLLDMVSRAR